MDDTDFWTKYGIRCRLTLDLDFEQTVTSNEELFGEQMTLEIASILDVDASLIRIESTEKGSVILESLKMSMGDLTHFEIYMFSLVLFNTANVEV